MKQEEVDFKRITDAISYITENYKLQPSLFDIADSVSLSSSHFQRLFTEWVGISPKKFLQYISIKYAKKILADSRTSLFETAHQTGLSGTGRLHDLFVSIEGMTPGEYRNGGESLTISYNNYPSIFGEILLGSTAKGICYMAFADDKEATYSEMCKLFPRATYERRTDDVQKEAISIFTADWNDLPTIKLHLKGTRFQLKVWETLLKIPLGALSTYGDIARYLDNPGASRAVGSAVGDNPVSFIIPCHRVIRSSGALGGYHWGLDRKKALIGWEAHKLETHNISI